MKCRVAGLLGRLALVGLCSGQTPRPPAGPPHYIEIKLPPGVISQTFFVRYALAGQDFGGWVQPLSGVGSYIVSTALEGHPATGIKAILYAPGCAIQTLDLALSGSNNPEYSFVCQPLKSIRIAGAVIQYDRFYGHEVKLQAKYLARWAPPFLRLDDTITVAIPVGEVAYLPADGRFRMAIPDLSQDSLAGAPDHAGELQIWAKDKTSDAIVAQLVPTGPGLIKTGIGGLKVRNDYPSEIVFAPCAVNHPPVHDRFAIRPDIRDACDH